MNVRVAGEWVKNEWVGELYKSVYQLVSAYKRVCERMWKVKVTRGWTLDYACIAKFIIIIIIIIIINIANIISVCEKSISERTCVCICMCVCMCVCMCASDISSE